MTECNRARIESKAPDGRTFTAAFDGGSITSDGGVMLLQAVEERCRILSRFGECFKDHRDPARITHTTAELAAQRVLGLALGYEDLNDHDVLRLDPLLTAAVGKRDRKRGTLASSVTLGRIENASPGLSRIDRYRKITLDYEKVDDLLIDVLLEAHDEPPKEAIIDLDATDAKIHGKQQGRFYHGYYDEYCYLPLYIFIGDFVVCARLRRANEDGAAGSAKELDRIVKRLRKTWPETRLVVRADSGFCRDWLLSWCEERDVDYVVGIARNTRLQAECEQAMVRAKNEHDLTNKAARVFDEFEYRTLDSWSQSRRVIAKAEYLSGGPNPRFIVTSFGSDEWAAKELYEDVYCARGEMENRIKEQQLDLFADRVSCQWERGNQTRMYYSAIAYALIEALRRRGIVKSCGWRRERHAATLMPSLNCTPRMTSLRSACPLSFRHLRSAA